MMRVCIKVRSGAYASSRQDTDYAGAGGGQEFTVRPNIRGTACLTSVCVQGDLKAVIFGQVSRVVETTFFAQRDL
jgi:hypothetical protein